MVWYMVYGVWFMVCPSILPTATFGAVKNWVRVGLSFSNTSLARLSPHIICGICKLRSWSDLNYIDLSLWLWQLSMLCFCSRALSLLWRWLLFWANALPVCAPLSLSFFPWSLNHTQIRPNTYTGVILSTWWLLLLLWKANALSVNCFFPWLFGFPSAFALNWLKRFVFSV